MPRGWRSVASSSEIGGGGDDIETGTGTGAGDGDGAGAGTDAGGIEVLMGRPAEGGVTLNPERPYAPYWESYGCTLLAYDRCPGDSQLRPGLLTTLWRRSGDGVPHGLGCQSAAAAIWGCKGLEYGWAWSTIELVAVPPPPPPPAPAPPCCPWGSIGCDSSLYPFLLLRIKKNPRPPRIAIAATAPPAMIPANSVLERPESSSSLLPVVVVVVVLPGMFPVGVAVILGVAVTIPVAVTVLVSAAVGKDVDDLALSASCRNCALVRPMGVFESLHATLIMS